uniref:NET domain-containing protein n=1 Tax=viral metagenome TaxID=1070528 RepID=A0A6C0EVF2_9ZZZZ
MTENMMMESYSTKSNISKINMVDALDLNAGLDIDVEVEEVSIADLNIVREKIESMPKFNQIEVLRILSRRKNVTLNENKYGIHINLTEVDKAIIDELNVYINYVNAQELNLNEMELQKEEFKNIYFTKDNKDNSGKNNKNVSLTTSTSSSA